MTSKMRIIRNELSFVCARPPFHEKNRSSRLPAFSLSIIPSSRSIVMEKEVAERLEKLRYLQEELGLDVPEGVTVEEDEKGFQALQSKILSQISEVKGVGVISMGAYAIAH